jgi:cyclopropane fatty-acyl-phospholipid synthase-like methyltransferase
MAQDFWVWLRKTMYYWCKMAFFDETPEDKGEAETISLDYILFSNF